MDEPIRAVDLPVTPRARAAEVSLSQLRALIGQLEALEPDQWGAVTECRPWTVHDVAAHITGQLVCARNPLAYAGLFVTWLRRYRTRSFLDGTNEAVVQARRDWTLQQVLEALRRDAPRAVPPAWARPIPLLGVAALPRSATFGYLVEVVMPRDFFMHRHDIARATSGRLEPEPSDSEIVAQVVRDLGRTWATQGLILRLTGHGGGA